MTSERTPPSYEDCLEFARCIARIAGFIQDYPDNARAMVMTMLYSGAAHVVYIAHEFFAPYTVKNWGEA